MERQRKYLFNEMELFEPDCLTREEYLRVRQEAEQTRVVFTPDPRSGRKLA